MVIELVVVGIKSRTSWTFNLTEYLETLPKNKDSSSIFHNYQENIQTP
jgi:hypothetical protein